MKESDLFVLPKTYEAEKTESKWYRFWEANNLFKADAQSDKPPYCIAIPPPNVTGVLHMGHALGSTLQDILIRWKRMSGYEALWVPGTDHAGIATQTVVERHLLKTKGKRRSDFSREEFLAIVWDWKEKHEQTVIEQLKAMGCSLDWSRLRFTMDEGCNKAVRTLFKKLFEDELIYKGDYVVNWDPLTQTALADDEVEYEEHDAFLYTFNYPLEDGSGCVSIATTRPETMLGDTAVAVSPKDKKYKPLVGKKVRHPLTHQLIPIIADPYVDPKFGTGMVKITPAHDHNDYKIGLNHNLPMINILTPDGKINDKGGEFAGMSREEARELVVARMKEMGFLVKIDPYKLRVGVSYRSKAILEPYLSKQWFIKMAPFVEQLKTAVTEKKVKILPSNWENTYFHWVNHLRDWCISRQLWWGHRIPVWYHKDDPSKMICHDGPGIPDAVHKEPENWLQDEDVLDTWFSSALWPLSTLGWPDETDELQKFYPTSVLETGHDILFFWVARMLAIGQYLKEEVPFPETFLHGLIFGKSYWRQGVEGETHYITGEERKSYDLGAPIPADVSSKWEKLSKSKGNVIDPLELIEDYGTDAMRMALCSCANQSPQIDLDYRRFEEFKNFANKVWNGARFVFLNLEGLSSDELEQGIDPNLLALEDKWILSRLNAVIEQINDSLGAYAFDRSATLSYDFFWKEFCAYYVEIVKPILFGKIGTPQEKTNKQKILVVVLSNCLRLMHPMAPFITEELFQLLKRRFSVAPSSALKDLYTQETLIALQSVACMTAPFPQVIQKQETHSDIDKAFSLIEKVLYAIRNIRGEMKIPPHLATDLYIVGPENDPARHTLEKNVNIIKALIKTGDIEFPTAPPPLPLSSTAPVGTLQIVIPLPEELKNKEVQRLKKEKQRLTNAVQRLKVQLANPNFVNKANPSLVETKRNDLTAFEKELQALTTRLPD